MCEIVEYTHTKFKFSYLRNSDNRQKVDTLFGFGWLPKIIIFGISIAFFWKKNMFCFLSMFLNNVEKNCKNIYSYIYTFKKIVFKVNIHNLP